jgi:hypothetical protein
VPASATSLKLPHTSTHGAFPRSLDLSKLMMADVMLKPLSTSDIIGAARMITVRDA